MKSRHITAPVTASVLLATSLLAGCASMKRDHIEVGSIPDDYRTNHPIVLQEHEETLDIPVATTDRKLTVPFRDTIDGFATAYARSGSGAILVHIPVGSANEAAAHRISKEVIAHLQKSGAAGGYITVDRYPAGTNDAAPLRLTYRSMAAQTGKCGRWPEDILQNTENKHYANFGCSYQNNLAAQIANPADLLQPRGSADIDAARRGKVINDWRGGNTPLVRNIQY
jgi:pilus assembly protein CpaD